MRTGTSTIIALSSGLFLLCVAAGIWAVMEYESYEDFNAKIVSANCTLIQNTLVTAGVGKCQPAVMVVKMPWDTDLKRAHQTEWDSDLTWWEVVPCQVSSMIVAPNGQGPTTLGATWVDFRQRVYHCGLCKADRAVATELSVKRIDGCVDVQGQPIKSCAQHYRDYLLNEIHAKTGGFQCSYTSNTAVTGMPNAAVTPGTKELVKENDFSMMMVAIVFFSLGGCIFCTGCCISLCCTVFTPKDPYFKPWTDEHGEKHYSHHYDPKTPLYTVAYHGPE